LKNGDCLEDRLCLEMLSRELTRLRRLIQTHKK